uniref:Transmembrane protein n=1 Tax=Nelumbo nucifera TaxID=4432 RepID=A0A823A0E7_NELNU|nr:TPA_asm: hypothetical protein HUJ06_017595 [Nelumbo nucifera]
MLGNRNTCKKCDKRFLIIRLWLIVVDVGWLLVLIGNLFCRDVVFVVLRVPTVRRFG